MIDPNGGNLRPFGTDLVGYKLRWAPDGRHLAFLGDYTDPSGGLHVAAWITQPDGSGPQRLPTQDDQLCLRECSRIGAFEWYPDGDRLAYYVSTPGTAGDLQAGSYTTRLSDSTIEAIGGPVPVWTDDGSSAARIRGNDLIEIVDPNGVRLALFSSGDQVAWSPDGEWLTYVTHESDPDRFDLWVADRSGIHRRRIALDATEPDWQP
jgi:Tol biopolymer transport system component